MAPAARGLPRVVCAAAGLALIASAATWCAAGATLGLLLGGMLVATLLLPPLVLTRTIALQRALIAAGVCDGIAVVWIIMLFKSPISLVQLILCYTLLVAWCTALLGLTCAIARRGAPANSSTDVVTAAIVVVLGLAWLTCPIWIPAATGARIDALLNLHPLFALNGAVPELGFWTHQPIAYRYLFTLGQDVPYALPPSVWPSAALHFAIGSVGLALSWWRGRT